LCYDNLYAGGPDSSLTDKQPISHSFTISNSFGLNFDKSKPAFYIDFSKKLGSKFSIGLRAGVYAYHQNIQEEAYEMIKELFKESNPGLYLVEFQRINVQGMTKVFSISSSYRFLRSISAGVCFGIKLYTTDFYRGVFSFSKPDYEYPLYYSVNEITPASESKKTIKAYYSAGVDYHVGRFEFGVYGDNIYSLGINLGISF
jgi:hypothetical protein